MVFCCRFSWQLQDLHKSLLPAFCCLLKAFLCYWFVGTESSANFLVSLKVTMQYILAEGLGSRLNIEKKEHCCNASGIWYIFTSDISMLYRIVETWVWAEVKLPHEAEVSWWQRRTCAGCIVSLHCYRNTFVTGENTSKFSGRFPSLTGFVLRWDVSGRICWNQNKVQCYIWQNCWNIFYLSTLSMLRALSVEAREIYSCISDFVAIGTEYPLKSQLQWGA